MEEDSEVSVPKPTIEQDAGASAEGGLSSAQIYEGNSYDLTAYTGLIMVVLIVLSCGTGGLATYCLPLVAVILGVVGLNKAQDSLNPERTRLFSWISIGVGGVIVALIALVVLAYVGLIVFAFAAEGGGF